MSKADGFNAASAAVEAYRAHEGGAWFAWGRMIRRNSYTIDPAEPRPDHLDEEKQRIHATAVKAVAAYAACDGVYPSDVMYSFANYRNHPPGWAE
jgi:hypothetical protein